jgi:hypothetical protein
MKAGLVRARAKGKTLGRPRTSPKIEAKIRDLNRVNSAKTPSMRRWDGQAKDCTDLGIGTSVAQRVLAPERRRPRDPDNRPGQSNGRLMQDILVRLRTESARPLIGPLWRLHGLSRMGTSFA